IRDFHVTGVQTCALPIFAVFDKDGDVVEFAFSGGEYTALEGGGTFSVALTPGNPTATVNLPASGNPYTFESKGFDTGSANVIARSEERRVGTEAGCRG